MKIETVRQYFKTLFLALIGKNPYRLELECIRAEHEKTKKDVEDLHHLYNICKENDDRKNEQITSLQNLVEVLRERIREKDSQIEQMAAAEKNTQENQEKDN